MKVVNVLVVIGIIATIIIAAIATGNSNGYDPNMNAWFATLIIPVLLPLVAVAYYNEKDPYDKK